MSPSDDEHALAKDISISSAVDVLSLSRLIFPSSQLPRMGLIQGRVSQRADFDANHYVDPTLFCSWVLTSDAVPSKLNRWLLQYCTVLAFDLLAALYYCVGVAIRFVLILQSIVTMVVAWNCFVQTADWALDAVSCLQW